VVRSCALLLVGTLAACALPPRETDRSTPEGTFRTFRGAIAHAEYEREWDCLSEGLRRALGMESRLDWKDARAVALKQDHRAIRGLSRAKITGPAETLPDGRVRLPVGVDVLFVRIAGTLTLRREAVLRIWEPGDVEPSVDRRVPDLKLTMATDGLGVALPGDLLRWLETEEIVERGMVLERFEAAWIWFLDGFTFGEEDPATLHEQVEQQRGKQG